MHGRETLRRLNAESLSPRVFKSFPVRKFTTWFGDSHTFE